MPDKVFLTEAWSSPNRYKAFPTCDLIINWWRSPWCQIWFFVSVHKCSNFLDLLIIWMVICEVFCCNFFYSSGFLLLAIQDNDFLFCYCRFMVMFVWLVLLSLKLWTGSYMPLIFCPSLMGIMKLQQGQCW